MNVAVVKAGEVGLTETFIRAHVERLPARVELISGIPPRIGSSTVLSQTRLSRVARKVRSRLFHTAKTVEFTLAYVKAFRRFGAMAVLAEYGTTGVHVLDACRCTGIPLIVHFHGFDASERPVINRHREAYRSLFREASAIIAPSRAMQRKLIYKNFHLYSK